jgi:tetratricopeptide (TPR) repeat protein/transcriptional regulator with XRE-family HTH domain
VGITTQESFGSLVRLYRREAGLTQEELAERAGLSVRGISDLERDVKQRPHRDTVELLAAAFDLNEEARAQFAATARQAPGPGSHALRAQTGAERVTQSLPIGGFLGALPAGPLVAREQELQRILTIVDLVNGGQGQTVLLAGEPGVGKTRLAQEVTLHLRDRGFVLAPGRCYETHQDVPFYPFLDALAALYAVAPAAVQAEAPRRWPLLAHLLPEMAPSPPPESGGDREEQERLFRAAGGFISALADETGVALLLDDLHWADSASLDLLQHLARHTRAQRILILGAYRDVDVNRRHPLRQALHALNREHLVERIAVRRLGPEATALLMATTLSEPEVPAEFVELVYRYTEGNPFFTDELLRALIDRGDLYRADGRWARRAIEEIVVPESIRDAIGERLSHLEEQTQELLHQASILGHAFGFEPLQRMSGREDGEIEAGIDEALAAGLIREQGNDAYEFNHALTRQTLYQELSSRQRRRLHRNAAEALEALSALDRGLDGAGRAAELAWHFLEADVAERALHYSLTAGDAAEGVFAHDEAERQYRRAASLAHDVQDERREAEALEKLGRVLRINGPYDEALTALERAMELQQRAGNLDAEGRIAATMGWVLSQVARPEEGISRLQAVAERMEASDPSPGLVELYTALLHLYFRRGQGRDAAALAEKAAVVAQAVGDERMRMQGEFMRAYALLHDRVDEALALFEDVIVAAEKVGDNLNLFRVRIFAAGIYASRGEFERSRTYVERNIELSQHIGPDWLPGPLNQLGDLLFRQGDWGAARENYERAAGMTSSLAAYRGGWVRLSLARLCLAEGKWREADRNLEEATGIVERTGDRSSVPKLHALLAARDLWQGQADAALARLEPLASQFDHDELMILAEAYIAMGNAARADEVVTSGVERAAAQNLRLAVADWRRLQGMLLAEQGRWEEAEPVFRDGCALASAIPYPFGKARILYEWGRSCLKTGAPAEARSRLEDALAIFRRLGARPYIERTEQALERLTSPRTEAGVHGRQ